MKKPIEEHLDIPDDDEEPLVIDGPGPRPATQTLAALAVEAALTRTARRRIESGRPIAVVVQTPSAAWVAPVQRAMQRRWAWTHVVAEAAPKPFRRSLTDGSETTAAFLAQGGRVLGISPAPERLLPPELVSGADLRFSLRATPGVLRRAIEIATGSRPRSVPTGLGSGLDFLELAASIRNSTSAASCVRRLQAATRSLSVADPALTDVPLLSQTHGYGPAMLWAQDLLVDLAAWRRGEIPFSAIDRCAVLASEPGLGKTSFVRSLAKTAGLPLISTSVGQWFADSPGHLDDVIKQIARVFSEAVARSPAIVFIDELDNVPDRNKLSSRGSDWWGPVVGFLLTTLDSAVSSATQELVIVGATNLPDRLDSALVRPGRLNRIIHISPPDERALIGIFRQHLADDLPNVDLTAIAQLAIGASGAAVAAWVKAARRSARQANRAMVVDDLVLVVAPQDDRNEEELRRCAVHEAGHAVLAHVLRLGEVQSVSLLRGPGSGGSLRVDETQTVKTHTALEAHAIISLAGRAAEIIVLGCASTGAGGSERSDLAQATSVVSTMHACFGMGSTLLYRGPPERAETLLTLDPALQRAVEDDLRRIEARALDLVRENLAAIMAVAQRLVQARHMDGRELAELVESASGVSRP